jgi:hypothetical protein
MLLTKQINITMLGTHTTILRIAMQLLHKKPSIIKPALALPTLASQNQLYTLSPSTSIYSKTKVITPSPTNSNIHYP